MARVTTETDIARAIAAGTLPSPQRVGGFALAAIRISGTGGALRPARNELTFRDPAIWLTSEMLARCNGLPVILEHPPSGTLDFRNLSAAWQARLCCPTSPPTMACRTPTARRYGALPAFLTTTPPH